MMINLRATTPCVPCALGTSPSRLSWTRIMTKSTHRPLRFRRSSAWLLRSSQRNLDLPISYNPEKWNHPRRPAWKYSLSRMDRAPSGVVERRNQSWRWEGHRDVFRMLQTQTNPGRHTWSFQTYEWRSQLLRWAATLPIPIRGQKSVRCWQEAPRNNLFLLDTQQHLYWSQADI